MPLYHMATSVTWKRALTCPASTPDLGPPAPRTVRNMPAAHSHLRCGAIAAGTDQDEHCWAGSPVGMGTDPPAPAAHWAHGPDPVPATAHPLPKQQCASNQALLLLSRVLTSVWRPGDRRASFLFAHAALGAGHAPLQGTRLVHVMPHTHTHTHTSCFTRAHTPLPSWSSDL